MYKFLVALAILSATSVPAVAQTPPAANPAQPAKPQTIKKRVCEVVEEEDPASRLGSHKICRTIEVPAPNSDTATNGQQASAPLPASNSGN
jgi:hypothetical protein